MSKDTAPTSAERELLDDEGENRAVRSFLLQYSCDRSITVGAMLAHMNRSGWRGDAPAFALSVRPEEHLTKAGAQLWIRHLLSLERAAMQTAEPVRVGTRSTDDLQHMLWSATISGCAVTINHIEAGQFLDAIKAALDCAPTEPTNLRKAAQAVVDAIDVDKDCVRSQHIDALRAALAPDRAPSIALLPLELSAVAPEVTTQAPEVAPSIDSAADVKWQRLLKAARTYANNYCQDAAELEYQLPFVDSGTRTEEARNLFAAIAALQPEGSACAK